MKITVEEHQEGYGYVSVYAPDYVGVVVRDNGKEIQINCDGKCIALIQKSELTVVRNETTGMDLIQGRMDL